MQMAANLRAPFLHGVIFNEMAFLGFLGLNCMVYHEYFEMLIAIWRAARAVRKVDD
jgi:hypothetical protein